MDASALAIFISLALVLGILTVIRKSFIYSVFSFGFFLVCALSVIVEGVDGTRTNFHLAMGGMLALFALAILISPLVGE